MNTATLAAELAPVLPAHLARQRWFGGKGRPADAVRVESVEELRGGWPALVRVIVSCAAVADGGPAVGRRNAGPARYQLLLGVRRPDDDDLTREWPDAAVGAVTVDGAAGRCFDALVDPDLALVLLRHVAPGHDAHRCRPIGVEQSNTSLVFDERLILKVFRRLASPNPEIEMIVALSRVGFAHVAEPIAVSRQAGDDLALLQPFLAGGVDGWARALASVGDAVDAGSTAGIDVGDAVAVGVLTAELHLALADAFGAAPAEPAAWADAAQARVTSARHPDIDHGAVVAAIDRIRHLDDAGAAIRVHGDYHLGQVLRTGSGWYVLDFEGEPTRPVDERRTPSSPLRDVAGMLRSFGYAAGAVLRGERGRRGDGLGDAAARAWEQQSRDAFLSSYLARMEGTDLLPARRASVDALLDVFELDKAVYEVAYEMGNRPDWVQIPLDGVRALLERSVG